MAKFDKLAAQDNYTLGRIGNIVVLHWTGVPNDEALVPLEQAFKYLQSANNQQKVGFFTIMEEEMMSEPTPQSVRAGVGRILHAYNDIIGATTIVYEGTGMKASLIRTMISTVNLMSRSNFPSKVENSAGAGITWLIKAMGSTTTVRANELTEALRGLREGRRAA